MAQEESEVPVADIVQELQRVRPNVWPNLRMIELGDRCLIEEEKSLVWFNTCIGIGLSSNRHWRSSWPGMVEAGLL
jgi:predicted protein tyrosine phosphatase